MCGGDQWGWRGWGFDTVCVGVVSGVGGSYCVCGVGGLVVCGGESL